MYAGHQNVIPFANPALAVSTAAAQPLSQAAPKKRKGGRISGLPEATQSPSGTWSVRMRRQGADIYVSGCKSKTEAERIARQRLSELEKKGTPKGRGPERTTLAQGLYDFALRHLPGLKGAEQEVRRINAYLRHSGLGTLKVTPIAEDRPAQQVYFDVSAVAPTEPRAIPKGLGDHRKKLLTQSADSERLRAVLAGRTVASIRREDLQALVNALKSEGKSASTIALERAVLRRFFYYAERFWNWQLAHNPATGLNMPKIDNETGRALTLEEEQKLTEAMASCRNKLLLPVTTLLRETAMRTSEPLNYARWKDVDWERCVLNLSDSKNGHRAVPLSPAALQALRDIGPGKPDEKIVRITYESLKAGWNRACKRAGVTNLRLYDLRHTGATRLMLQTGNIGLVKALTGHKTMTSLERYVRIDADDVVTVLHKPREQPAPSEPISIPQEQDPMKAAALNVLGQLSTQQLQALLIQNLQAGLAQQASPQALERVAA